MKFGPGSFGFARTKGGGGSAPALTPLEGVQAALEGVQGGGAFTFLTATINDTSFPNLIAGGAALNSQFLRKFTEISATDGGLRLANMLFQPGAAAASGLMTVVAQIKVPGAPTSYNLTPEVTASAFGSNATPVYIDEALEATRADILAALGDNASHTVRMTGLPDGDFGGGAAVWYARRLVLIPEVAEQYAAAVAAALLWVSEGLA